MDQAQAVTATGDRIGHTPTVMGAVRVDGSVTITNGTAASSGLRFRLR